MFSLSLWLPCFLFLSVCLALRLSLSFCLYVLLALSLFARLAFSLSLFFCLSVSLFLCLALSQFFPSADLSGSLSLSLYVSARFPPPPPPAQLSLAMPEPHTEKVTHRILIKYESTDPYVNVTYQPRTRISIPTFVLISNAATDFPSFFFLFYIIGLVKGYMHSLQIWKAI